MPPPTRFIAHDGAVWVFHEHKPDLDVFGEIVIGNNLIVGAGSVVTKISPITVSLLANLQGVSRQLKSFMKIFNKEK
jgi:ABC-type antimicrobial peptide transport system permease subunit